MRDGFVTSLTGQNQLAVLIWDNHSLTCCQIERKAVLQPVGRGYEFRSSCVVPVSRACSMGKCITLVKRGRLCSTAAASVFWNTCVLHSVTTQPSVWFAWVFSSMSEQMLICFQDRNVFFKSFFFLKTFMYKWNKWKPGWFFLYLFVTHIILESIWKLSFQTEANSK